MDDQAALPTPINASQPATTQVVDGNSPALIMQNVPKSQTNPDALARATAAVQAVIAQTAQNPAARMQAIIDIKATYIRDQFGVDITQ